MGHVLIKKTWVETLLFNIFKIEKSVLMCSLDPPPPLPPIQFDQANPFALLGTRGELVAILTADPVAASFDPGLAPYFRRD